MPDEAASAPATTTPSAPSAPASPSPSAAPAAAVPTTPTAPSAPAAKAETPGSPAGSTKQDVRTGLMDAAKAALFKTRSGQPSAQTPQGQATSASAPPASAAGDAAPQGTETESHDAASASQDNGDEAQGASDPDADTEDETKPPPFNEHPRWKKLTRDFEAATAQIKELQPDADQYRKIVHYMQTFELETEDVAEAYDILAKLKHHPQLAYQKLKPIMEELENRIGERLPEDLAKRVKEGFMDADSAKELARQRALTTTAQQHVTRFTDQQQRGQAQQLTAQVQSAVAKWDAQQVSKNPDFIRLRPFVEDAARAIMAKEGKARTPDAAIAVLDRAMKAVTERLQPLRAPVNGSTPKQPAAGTPSTAVAPPDPKSLREAMQLGLEGRYRVS